jgi:Electron transfer DM13
MNQKLISSRTVVAALVSALVLPSILTVVGLSSLNSCITADFLQPETAFAQDQQTQSLLSGQFMGVGDGIHEAEGLANEISLEDGRQFIRFENFKVTNGPDLFVYLATDKSASDFVDLGKLKANNGNQNYQIPPGTDLSKYNTVVIWCKAFSVLFGSAELKA